MSEERNNILICDDHALVAEGIKLTLDGYKGFRVVGIASNGQEALDFLSGNEVDVILMDINMPVMDGVQACKKIKSSYDDIKVIALSMIDDVKMIGIMAAAGSDGYLLKNASVEEMQRAIISVKAGNLYYKNDAYKHILSTARKSLIPKSLFPKLTGKEKEILQLIMEENTSPEIAHKIGVTLGTVETHRRNLISKLGVKNTAGLVRVALEYKLI